MSPQILPIKDPARPIASFDSGKGGVFHAVLLNLLLPHEHLIVLADNANFPYGNKAVGIVRKAAGKAIRSLQQRRCKIINCACFTAFAALDPQPPVFGPFHSAVDLAIEAAMLQPDPLIGWIGTKTLVSTGVCQKMLRAKALLRGLKCRIEAIKSGGLVELFQRTPKSEEALMVMAKYYLRKFSRPLTVLVPGCTHFELRTDILRREVCPHGGVVVLPSQDLALRTKSRLTASGMLNPQETPGQVEFLTTRPDEAEVAAMRALFYELKAALAPLMPAA